MRYPIQEFLEDEDFGNPVKVFSDRFPFKKVRGATLYRRGNMYYIIKGDEVVASSHVDDYDYLIRGKTP